MNRSHVEFGESLRIEREKRGWDQLALARALKTTQQTISRWEKGDSRPKTDMVHKIAQLFEADTDEWLMRAGHKIDKPVRPLLPTLPFDKLSEEEFEFFNTDFVQKLHPRSEVHRYGHRGHDQEGIDLYADEDDKRLDYQAKRHQQFGPEKVKKVVEDYKLQASNHYILLSRPATPDARKEMDKHKGWSLWDAEDISRKIRALPMNDRLDLVDTYFPAYRKDFLGVEEPSPWLTPTKYFMPFNHKERLFNHDWEMMGRSEEIDKLTEFIKSSTNQTIVLVGRGGVGKTRLLKAVAEQIKDDSDVRFMTQKSEPTPAQIDQLPKQGLLIIEDAHEYTDLRALLNRIAIERPRLKIVISTRQYGLSRLEDQLLDAGVMYDHDENVTIGDMKKAHTEALVKQIIPDDEHIAERIAAITLDCPLAAVVGARLVTDGEIKPEILNNSDKFRQHIMRSFRNVITGNIGGIRDAALVKDLLDLVALIQPINTTDPEFEKIATTILGRPYDAIIRDLSSLEDAGVVIRRKSGMRIAPDLLADFIRADANYIESTGTPTRYADRVFKSLSGELASNLMVNLSQLDWRLKADGFQGQLLDDVWGELENKFLAGDINVRIDLLGLLEKVAYYQPAQAIKFVKLALDNPTEKVTKTEFDDFFDSKKTYGAVIMKLPEIIKMAAYNGDYLAESLDLLRVIAAQVPKSDRRPQEHPVSIMKEIVAIKPRKPINYIDLGVEHVIGWLGTETVNFSPFDVLDGALLTEGHDPVFKGRSIVMNQFSVFADVVKETRDKITNAAFNQITEGSVRSAVRAVSTLEEALRGPMQDATDEQKAKWLPGQIEILDRLKSIAADPSLDPYVSVEIRRAVNWHASFSKTSTKKAAIDVLKSIPTTLDFRLARALADGWGWTFERGENFERDDARFSEWKDKLADEIVADFATRLPELVTLLEERVSTLETLDTPSSNDGARFIWELLQRSPQLVVEMGNKILANPLSSLAPMIGTVIGASSTKNYEQSVDLAERAMALGDMMTNRRVAHALSSFIPWTQPPSAKELSLVNELLSSDDEWTRKNIVRIVRRIPKADILTGIDLLCSIDFSESVELASEVLTEFHPNHGIYKVEQLTPDQFDTILDRLVKIKDVSDYAISEFVHEASFHYPEKILKLLFDRVDCKADLDFKRGYYPIPIAWERSNALRINETPFYQKALETVRDWMDEERDDWQRHHYAPEIFRAVASGKDSSALNVLYSWAASDDPNQVQAAVSLISEFPVRVMWDNPEKFVAILEHADELGKETYQRASSALHSMAIQGGRSGTYGEPFAEDLIQKENAEKMLAKLPTNSAAKKFYASLLKQAEDSIERSRRDGEEED